MRNRIESDFPKWRDDGNGYTTDDDKQRACAMRCGMLGFDLVEFDLWASSLPECGLKTEMRERRQKAVEAMQENNHEAILRHLEWMLNRKLEHDREEFLLPLAQRDKKRQDGTKKERKPRITKWIERTLRGTPDAKSPDLWDLAPGYITDVIGKDRFSKRVTEVRKKIDGRK